MLASHQIAKFLNISLHLWKFALAPLVPQKKNFGAEVA